jgi:AcrR family transcriptional regulator
MQKRSGRRARLSRSEQKAATRAALITAAERAFGANGFEGTTVEAIAAAAGFTVGALYSHFAGKAELFVAVLDRRKRRDQSEVNRILSDATLTLRERIRALAEHEAHHVGRARRWIELAWEFRVRALRDPTLRRYLDATEYDRPAELARAIENAAASFGGTLAAKPEQVALLFVTLANGLAYQRLIDPGRVPDELFVAGFEALARGLLDLDWDRR